jgi:hypothetical protein
MAVSGNIDIRFEKGVFHISAEIPVAAAKESIESLVCELNSQLLGEEQTVSGQSAKIAPKMLNESDAARYIGRSPSFLRSCRYKSKRGKTNSGPKYVRYLDKLIFYPVKELDDWLNRSRLFSTCLEEKICSEVDEILKFPISPSEGEVISNA